MFKKDYANALAEGWNGGAFVARSETKKFTGGAITGRTVANIESQCPENKVPGRMLVGRKIVYPVKPFSLWIAKYLLKTA